MFQITLKAARVNKGLTLKEVAERTGKHPETISKWEEDSTDIPRSLVKDLLIIYGAPEDHIFFGKESVFTGLDRKKRTVKSST